jgi:AraC-like DNA-binding protein
MKNDKRQINTALKAAIARLAPEAGKFPTAVEGLQLVRREADLRTDCFDDPVFAVIVQGHKQALIAGREYRFGEGQFIVIGMDLPSLSNILGATRKKPHLALSLALDRSILNQLASSLPALQYHSLQSRGPYKGVTVAEVTTELLDACLRLISLLDTPERIPVIAPMIIREIHYDLLTGPEGEDFRLLGTHEATNSQIAQAVSLLRENYREPFNLAELAGQVNMSPTSFSRHFSRITGTSPLQFQKRLRLYEAQRMMLTEDRSAESVAYEVGYDSPTQFNREYKRQFGDPPHRDVSRLLLPSRSPE